MDRTETEERKIVERHGGLVGRTALVSLLTLVSRLLGFVREVVMASVFGDGSAISDAFFTAWRVPNLFRRLFGEGALSTSLQAAVTEADAEGGDEAGRRLFLSTVRSASAILLVVCAVTMLLIAWMPEVMPVTSWRWLGADAAPVQDLAVRLMPYVLLVCVTALAGGALFVRGHYFVPSVAPAVMNVGWIGALLWVGYTFGWSDSAEGSREVVFERQWDMARLLAWGVLAAGVVQLLLHVPPLLRFGLLRRTESTAGAEASGSARDVILGAAPLALGAAVYQINVMIDGLMAEGMLADGGPTALYYANRVQQFPLALVATAAITSVFPRLKAHGHLGELVPLRTLHDRTQLAVLFLALPAAAGLIALAAPIASVLFEHGNYGAAGVARVAEALTMLAVALLPAGAVGLLGRTYIALGDTRTPVRISIWMVLVNVLLNVLLVAGLRMDVAGFALATALTSWGNLAWLGVGLQRTLGLPPGQGDFLRRSAPILGAAIATGVAARAVWFFLSEPLGRSAGLTLAILAGSTAFLIVCQLSGIPEWEALRARVMRGRGR